MSLSKRKHGRKKIKYSHPDLEPILSETYGIIVYQEQVMQITNKIASFSLAQADILRRAMGKKKRRLMKGQKEAFITGAGEREITQKTAKDIFELIEKFANTVLIKAIAQLMPSSPIRQLS